MNNDFWHRQASEPLFPGLLWSRPETKHTAGKLLIVGGNKFGFAVPAEAYAAASKAGIGSTRVLLPGSLQRTVGKLFPEAEFAPANNSGSFAGSALAELLDASRWADGVLLAGDLGRNSETTTMLETFAGKYNGQLTISKDSADFFCNQPNVLLERRATLLVVNLGQLQKLGHSLHLPYALTSDLDALPLVERLHELTNAHPEILVLTRQKDTFFVAVQGQVSTTLRKAGQIWMAGSAAKAATWWLQIPERPFEAITTALYE